MILSKRGADFEKTNSDVQGIQFAVASKLPLQAAVVVSCKGFASGFAALDAHSAFCYWAIKGRFLCPVQTEFCQTCKRICA